MKTTGGVGVSTTSVERIDSFESGSSSCKMTGFFAGGVLLVTSHGAMSQNLRFHWVASRVHIAGSRLGLGLFLLRDQTCSGAFDFGGNLAP